jgi:hypothetical protein
MIILSEITFFVGFLGAGPATSLAQTREGRASQPVFGLYQPPKFNQWEFPFLALFIPKLLRIGYDFRFVHNFSS